MYKQANTNLQKQSEKLEMAKKELQEINATKDKLFSIIAHDLESPFNAILGFSELLIKQVQLGETEKIKQFSEIILNSSQKSHALIENLIEWSQLQTGKLKFNPIDVEINKLLNDIFLLYENIAIKKEITLSINSPNKIIANVDKNMLSTVLRNLVSNAIKFTNPKGNYLICKNN